MNIIIKGVNGDLYLKNFLIKKYLNKCIVLIYNGSQG